MKIEKAEKLLNELRPNMQTCLTDNECKEYGKAVDMAIDALHSELEKIKASDIWQDIVVIRAENEQLKKRVKELEWDLRSYELTHEKLMETDND